MKRIALLLFIASSSLLQIFGQNVVSSLPVIGKGEILIIGEDKFLDEIRKMDIEIVEHYTSLNKGGDLYVFLDLPSCYNIFVDEYISSNGSGYLKEFLRETQVGYKAKYMLELLSGLRAASERCKGLKVVCINGNKQADVTLRSIEHIIRSSPGLPEHCRQFAEKCEKLRQNDRSDRVEFERLVSEFRDRFMKDMDKFRSVMHERDFAFMTKILDDIAYTNDECVMVMERNILKHYGKDAVFISINDAANANKRIIEFDSKYSEGTKPLACNLNNSPEFAGKVHSLYISAQKVILPETVLDGGKVVPSKAITNINRRIPEDIYDEMKRSDESVSIKLPDPNSSPGVHTKFDGFILFKEAHSAMPGNKERLEF